MKRVEIASEFQNWIKYFDTSGRMEEAEFDKLTMEQRIAILDDAFGEEKEPGPEPCYKCGAMCAQRTCD